MVDLMPPKRKDQPKLPATAEPAKRGRPASDKEPQFTRLSQAMRDALDEMVAEIRPATTKAALIELAVEKLVHEWKTTRRIASVPAIGQPK